MLLCKAREELLRALPDESPAQVAEDQNAVAIGLAAIGGFHAGRNRPGDGGLAGQTGNRVGHPIAGCKRRSAMSVAVAVAIAISLAIAIAAIFFRNGGGQFGGNGGLNPFSDGWK